MEKHPEHIGAEDAHAQAPGEAVVNTIYANNFALNASSPQRELRVLLQADPCLNIKQIRSLVASLSNPHGRNIEIM